jgi:geranylgeranyl diphosphate synthase type I
MTPTVSAAESTGVMPGATQAPGADSEPAGSHPPPPVLATVRDLVDGPTRAAVGALSPAVRRVATYHLGWTQADGTPLIANGGKAVRPALAVLSAQAVGARPAVGVPGAIAVELVHNFSLLHDDVMDGDEERRHRPTAWTVFGRSAAILAGDALLALAFDVLLDATPADAGRAAQRSLAAATQELIVGQVDDLDFEERLDVDVRECLQMAAGKTASLIACAASIGAQLAGAPDDRVAALRDFGHQLGLAFQLVDDLLGIWGAEETTGKPVGADLRARKKSLPVVAAMASGTSAGRALRDLYAGEELHAQSDPALVARAAALVDEAGGRRWAADEAGRRLRLAADALGSVPLDPAARDDLLQIARYVTSRDH